METPNVDIICIYLRIEIRAMFDINYGCHGPYYLYRALTELAPEDTCGIFITFIKEYLEVMV